MTMLEDVNRKATAELNDPDRTFFSRELMSLLLSTGYTDQGNYAQHMRLTFPDAPGQEFNLVAAAIRTGEYGKPEMAQQALESGVITSIADYGLATSRANEMAAMDEFDSGAELYHLALFMLCNTVSHAQKYSHPVYEAGSAEARFAETAKLEISHRTLNAEMHNAFSKASQPNERPEKLPYNSLAHDKFSNVIKLARSALTTSDSTLAQRALNQFNFNELVDFVEALEKQAMTEPTLSSDTPPQAPLR